MRVGNLVEVAADGGRWEWMNGKQLVVERFVSSSAWCRCDEVEQGVMTRKEFIVPCELLRVVG